MSTDTIRAQRFFHRGLYFYERENWSEAVDNLREALDLFPQHVPARMHLGAALARQRLYRDAVHVLEEGRQLPHLDTEALLSLLRLIASICIIRQDYPAAEYYLDAALRLAPDDFRLRNRLASMHCKAGNFEEGFDLYLNITRSAVPGE